MRQESTKLCLVSRLWNVSLNGLEDGADGDLSRKAKNDCFKFVVINHLKEMREESSWAFGAIVITLSDMWPVRIKYRPSGSMIWDVRVNGVEPCKAMRDLCRLVVAEGV